jgi:hypothetical protein
MGTMRRTVLGIFAALILTAATACTITTEDPGYVPPAPLPPLEQLEQAALADAEGYSTGDGAISFITEDRTVACSLTSARGEHIDLPYERNNLTTPPTTSWPQCPWPTANWLGSQNPGPRT